MAKAPRPGHVKTRLASVLPPALVVQLYRALIEDTIALGRAVGASIAIVCPPDDADDISAWLPSDLRVVPQRGNGLADGLASAFDILCEPPRRVIAFNGDSPHLAPSVLESAFSALADHDVVLGPCEDGGYFLIGATQTHAGLFDPRAMGTTSALDAISSQTRRLGLSSFVTEVHYDVDVPANLARLAQELAIWPERAPKTAVLLEDARQATERYHWDRLDVAE
ncbi:MAG: TIGR04282 family arsenosugar biosynthesis glycosyltransferase [Gemmatimonadales bacterium]